MIQLQEAGQPGSFQYKLSEDSPGVDAMHIVLSDLGVDYEYFASDTRVGRVVHARRVIAILLVRHLGYSYPRAAGVIRPHTVGHTSVYEMVQKGIGTEAEVSAARYAAMLGVPNDLDRVDEAEGVSHG